MVDEHAQSEGAETSGRGATERASTTTPRDGAAAAVSRSTMAPARSGEAPRRDDAPRRPLGEGPVIQRFEKPTSRDHKLAMRVLAEADRAREWELGQALTRAEEALARARDRCGYDAPVPGSISSKPLMRVFPQMRRLFLRTIEFLRCEQRATDLALVVAIEHLQRALDAVDKRHEAELALIELEVDRLRSLVEENEDG
jgi:hypothetical protein